LAVAGEAAVDAAAGRAALLLAGLVLLLVGLLSLLLEGQLLVAWRMLFQLLLLVLAELLSLLHCCLFGC
jgi:hypothetical protein